MTATFGVTDDGTPRAAIAIAGQALHEFGHRGSSRTADGRPGWNYLPDVYACLGELKYLVGLLPEVTNQMVASLGGTAVDGRFEVASGSQYDGRPLETISAAQGALRHIGDATRALDEMLTTAQAAIEGGHYTGPDLSGHI